LKHKEQLPTLYIVWKRLIFSSIRNKTFELKTSVIDRAENRLLIICGRLCTNQLECSDWAKSKMHLWYKYSGSVWCYGEVNSVPESDLQLGRYCICSIYYCEAKYNIYNISIYNWTQSLWSLFHKIKYIKMSEKNQGIFVRYQRTWHDGVLRLHPNHSDATKRTKFGSPDEFNAHNSFSRKMQRQIV
jgi:hypothetical protein